MLCNICKKNEARVYLTQIVEGKFRKVDLCEPCAKSKKVDDASALSLFEDLSGAEMHSKQKPKTPSNEPENQRQCGFCGYTQARFKKTGRLGCSLCYEVFEEGLEQVFKTMHRGVRHTGKVPKKLRSTWELRERASALQSRLDEAIAKEDFEAAALLRDELKEVKQKMQNQ